MGWLVPLGLAVAALQAAAGPLPAPPLTHPSSWSAWADGRDPLTVAFSLVRVLALGAAWYGLGAVVVGVALRFISAGLRGPNAVTGRLAAAVDRLTLPPLRRLVAASVGVTLSTGFLGTATAGAVVPHAVVNGPVTTTTSTTEPGDGATVTMHLLVPATPPPATPPAPPPAPPAPPAVAARTGAPPWTVQPGQSFWSIADSVLRDAWGRRPTSAEIVPYWKRLIEANRPALADPANPDLIFPGQVFTLPEVTPR